MPASPAKPATGDFPTARSAECPFDPATGYTEYRETDPIARVSCPAGVDAWLVTRYDDARTVLADPRLSSRRAPSMHVVPNADLDDVPDIRSILQTDGDQHTQLRRLLTSEFTVKRMQALRPYLQGLIDDHLDKMLAGPGPVDLVEALALPIPSLVICELLGVPYAQRDRFQQHSNVLTATDVPYDTLMASVGEIQGFLRELVVAKMATPADDLLSRLIQRAAAAGSPMTVPELVSVGVSLLIAGHETTANTIALSVATLLSNPEQLQLLREDPGLMPSAVEEMLRYLSVLQFGLLRYVTEDIPLSEETLHAGDWLVVALSAGNRDVAVFPDADQVDVTRAASAHLGFGYGAHQCLGQQLARLELELVLSTLFRRIPSLKLAVPLGELRFKNDTLVYGVRELPVTWDTQA
ncbi:MAG: cytochrome [Amycolatopsis sp.]|jgi:cytochrome P450|uniref:cytochrome P450 n=1 Tax=Amycolatopsis sp. TaxID=37632 RepID=UPI0026239C8F|nr:cytochrome P450 [Amycolatopsis sp.]MCU1683824.1 cytochrome [Amycolatopsis sp.]